MARSLVEIIADFERLTSELRATIPQITTAEEFQAALDDAQPGQIVELQAGIVYAGTFRVPRRTFDPPVIIRTAGGLPDRRITPADRPLLAVIQPVSNEGGIRFEQTSGWVLDGVAFLGNPDGNGDVLVVQQGDRITVDRVLCEAPEVGQKRFMRGNGTHITLRRSHVAGVWKSGQDSQAFCAWDGAGPYAIVDNYLEAASENIMFGGADSSAPEHMPSDILIEGNTITKPLAWKGQRRNVKNLLELKVGQRVTIRNNLFERNWTDGQSGWSIVFTVRNQNGAAVWTQTTDVLFERNIVRDVQRGIAITGYDSNYPSGQTTGIVIRNNLVVTEAEALRAISEVGTLDVTHNTFINGWTPVQLVKGSAWENGVKRAQRWAVQRFIYRDNLAFHRQYGIFCEGSGTTGTAAVARMTESFDVMNNVLAGGSGAYVYPGNLRPSEADHVAQFEPEAGRLTVDSVYRGAGSDGKDLGADLG